MNWDIWDICIWVSGISIYPIYIPYWGVGGMGGVLLIIFSLLSAYAGCIYGTLQGHMEEVMKLSSTFGTKCRKDMELALDLNEFAMDCNMGVEHGWNDILCNTPHMGIGVRGFYICFVFWRIFQ